MLMSAPLNNITVTAMLSVSILLDLLPVNVMMDLLVTEPVVKVRIIIHSTLYFFERRLAASINVLNTLVSLYI